MSQIEKIQLALIAAGYDPGRPDGVIGKKTEDAILSVLHTLPKKPVAPVATLETHSKFNAGSAARLAQAHPELQRLMNAAREKIVFEIMDSQRGKAAQEKAFAEGHSKAHFGQSAHNWTPALALDIRPEPLDWNDRAGFIALSKVILPLAKEMGIPIRWGGDWDGDGDMTDQKLVDLPHYELTPWQDFAKHAKPFAG